MPRHFFYSVRLFAGGFPFAVARIVFESQNTGVEPRNTLSTFFRVHLCAFVIQKTHYLNIFRVHSWFLLSPCYLFVCFVFFVVKSFFSHSCPFVFIRGSYSLSLLSFLCFFVGNNSFDIRVHSCSFVVLTLPLLSLSCVSCFSWFKKHTPSTFFRGSCRPFQFFRA